MKPVLSTSAALLLILGLGAAKTLLAQAPTYVRYTTADGLPTNYVYGVIEDEEGTIWAYTENGLAKFDGYSFQHYSTADGLPGNDITWALPDPEGRIWLYTYQNRPAYLWKDSIVIAHDQQAVLHGFSYDGRPIYRFQGEQYWFYNNGWISLRNRRLSADEFERFGQDWNLIRKVPADQPLDEFTFNSGHWYTQHRDSFFIWHTGDSPLKREPTSDSTFIYRQIDSLHWKTDKEWVTRYCGRKPWHFQRVPGHPSKWLVQGWKGTDEFLLLDLEKKEVKQIRLSDYKFFPEHYSGLRINAFSWWIISDAGNIEFDYEGRVLRRLTWTETERDWSLLTTYTDREGNIWQGTRNGGLLMIPVAYQGVQRRILPDSEISSIERLLRTPDNRTLAVASSGEVYEVRKDTIITLFQHTTRSRFRSAILHGNNLVLSLDFALLYLDLKGSDAEVEYLAEKFSCLPDPASPKAFKSDLSLIDHVRSLVMTKRETLLHMVGPHKRGLYQWELPSEEQQSCWVRKLNVTSRSLFVNPITDQLYAGELDGLYKLANNELTPYLQQEAELKDVSAVYATADQLWIGTESNGLFCYHNATQVLEKVAAVNYVHAIRPDGAKGVLVATNEGVLLVPSEHPGSYAILGANDGLPTDKIEDVLALGDSTLLVATNYGLYEIQRTPVTLPTVEKDVLRLLALKANEERITDEDFEQLPYTTTQLRFDFHLRSYASRGNIHYRTRLEPLEAEWSEGMERSRSYFGLQPGRYTFHLQAEDAYGRIIDHPPTTVVIRAALWQKRWFKILAGSGFIALIIAYALRRIRRTNRELAQEKALSRRLAEMEMQALKAQMNPHFIFNALGSIQYFIQTQEVDLADDYLTRFARLMRLYLDSSRETLLPLEQEIALLRNYTDLEMMRFEEQFQVEISVANNIPVASTIVPSMILQPFVENAIMHGLSERRDKQGRLSIRFEQAAADTLRCTISDNGVGRVRAGQRGKPGHRSRGMQIVQDKIDTLSAADLLQVDYTIEDAEPAHPTFPGTIVTINFKQQEDGDD
ncbi:MAG: histidine kinase [Bacteroidota bacterium]